MSEELKALCPWCCAELKVTYEENRIYQAVCRKCGKCITFQDKSFYGAIETLNRRTQPDNPPTSHMQVGRFSYTFYSVPDSNPSLLMGEAMLLDHIWIRDILRPISSNYALIDNFNTLFGKPRIITLNANGYRWKDYGKTWLAYAHKPEKDGDKG
jgi:hypothetical protein